MISEGYMDQIYFMIKLCVVEIYRANFDLKAVIANISVSKESIASKWFLRNY